MKQIVLVVEDDPDIAECLHYNLELEGLETKVVATAEAALSFLLDSGTTPSVVLLDPHALDIPTLQLSDLLRRELERKGIPLILMTAFTSDAGRLPCFQIAADYYISQPYSMREISTTIKTAINHSGNGSRYVSTIS
jgi:DNA-binding response OmpR family regulator